MERKYSEHITMLIMLNDINVAAAVTVIIVIIIIRMYLKNHEALQKLGYYFGNTSLGSYETQDLLIHWFPKR